MDKYGTLYINVDSVPPHGLLQLTNTKGDVVRQNVLPQNGKAAFRYLKPGDYMVRILIDDNDNGTWDTGDYANHRQPEHFIYYMEKVSVRANWDIKIDFDTHMFTPAKYANKFYAKKKNGGSRR